MSSTPDDVNALTQSTPQAVDDLKTTYTIHCKTMCLCRRIITSQHERILNAETPIEFEVRCECGDVFIDTC